MYILFKSDGIYLQNKDLIIIIILFRYLRCRDTFKCLCRNLKEKKDVVFFVEQKKTKE